MFKGTKTWINELPIESLLLQNNNWSFEHSGIETPQFQSHKGLLYFRSTVVVNIGKIDNPVLIYCSIKNCVCINHNINNDLIPWIVNYAIINSHQQTNRSYQLLCFYFFNRRLIVSDKSDKIHLICVINTVDHYLSHRFKDLLFWVSLKVPIMAFCCYLWHHY